MESFLKRFTTKPGEEHNYTKIPNPKFNITGGSYSVPLNELPEFYALYKRHVFIEGKQAYLTEKQLENGPLVIDIDFRYSVDVEERQHTIDHITKFILLMLDCINKIKINNGKELKCYVFERDNVNCQEKITKDGIHLMVDLQMDVISKIILRKMILKEINDIWSDIKITNNWDEVIDEGVIKMHSNWQMFGSRKPGHEDYKLKYIFACNYDNEWSLTENKVSKEWILENFEKLLARNTNLVNMQMNDNIEKEYGDIKSNRKTPSKNQVKLITNISSIKQAYDVTNQEELDDYVEDFHRELTATDYTLKEAHYYTMILPSEYYGPQSYDKWIRVGWALKNTNKRLFITWLKFSSQSTEFDYSDIPDLYEKWCGFDTYNKEGLTLRSIMYWCKISNEAEYRKVYDKTLQHFVNVSVHCNTDYDLAYVLYQMYKESFICVNIKDCVWYEFINNRWQLIDQGHSLRAKISVEMYKVYHDYALTKQELKEEMEKIKKTYFLLKKTSNKNTIMSECKEIFYDKDFYSKLNINDYLLGCNNCIIDIKNKEARKGKHDDYVSKTTNLDYKPISYYEKHAKTTIAQINTFMEQLFPNANLRTYMWQHLASTLLGTNENQTFNMYIGTGANGKSMLINLMSKVLGEYKGTVPISLVTQKRGSIGGTSSEIYALIGVRMAVMQEPTKGDKLNEGVVKEITGGDPIQCRPLFQNSITFRPQCKLVVASNVFFNMQGTNDDGTWRRIRVVNFGSKFTKNPYQDPQFPTEKYPDQFLIDTKLEDKFDTWAPVMLSMLVQLAFQYQGKVHDCDEVMAATHMYRQSQDIYLEYISARIVKNEIVGQYRLKISVVQGDFKDWYKQHYDNSKAAPVKELKEKLESMYGKCPAGGWSNISLVMESD
jgi:P4 family phage/plasmid primase-like protien